MNKGELIAGMAEESGVSKADAEKVLNAFLSQVEKALCAGDKVQLTGFGSFEVKEDTVTRTCVQACAPVTKFDRQGTHCDPSREDAGL